MICGGVLNGAWSVGRSRSAHLLSHIHCTHKNPLTTVCGDLLLLQGLRLVTLCSSRRCNRLPQL